MRAVDRVLLGLLIVDGLIVGVLSVAFAYLRVGGVAIPFAAVGGGLLNCQFLWLASRMTASGLRFLPLLAWLLVLVVAAMPGPGGDVALMPDGPMLVPTLLLLVIGLGLPMALIWTGRLPAPETS